MIRDDSRLSRSGSAALVPVQPKGRFTSWTQSATRSWRSCTATATRWRLCALPRIATSWAERGNLTGKWPSGRWNRRNCSQWLIQSLHSPKHPRRKYEGTANDILEVFVESRIPYFAEFSFIFMVLLITSCFISSSLTTLVLSDKCLSLLVQLALEFCFNLKVNL